LGRIYVREDKLMYCTKISREGEQLQYVYKFPNGYGASVIKGPHTYGGSEDLWELAVLEGEELCYTTPVSDDVIGHLTNGDVNMILDQIKDLPNVA
jgi:hypothetical protein